MSFPRFVTLRSFVYSIGIHAAALALLTLSVEFDTYATPKPKAARKIVKAVVVDARQVEVELNRFKQQDEKKEQQIKAEERRLEELKKERARLQREKKKEQQQLAKAEKARKAEEKKRKQAQADRKRLGAERREAAEQKKQEEQRLAEARRQQQLQNELQAEEEDRLAAQRRLEDQAAIAEYTNRIRRQIESVFRSQPGDAGLSGTIIIEMIPSGDVVSVRVTKSSGNESFDQRADTAVRKASPFTLPGDPRLFQKMRRIEIEFEPGG